MPYLAFLAVLCSCLLSMLLTACGNDTPGSASLHDQIEVPRPGPIFAAFGTANPNLAINVVVDRDTVKEEVHQLKNLMEDPETKTIKGDFSFELSATAHTFELDYYINEAKFTSTYVAFAEPVDAVIEAGKDNVIDFTQKSLRYVDGDNDSCDDYIEVSKGVSPKDGKLVPLPDKPPTPQLTVTGNIIKLNWPKVPCATAYSVYFNTGGSVTKNDTAIENIAFVPDDAVITHAHASLTAGTTYFYRVAAINSAGASDLSDEASATAAAAIAGLWDAATWDGAAWGD